MLKQIKINKNKNLYKLVFIYLPICFQLSSCNFNKPNTYLNLSKGIVAIDGNQFFIDEIEIDFMDTTILFFKCKEGIVGDTIVNLFKPIVQDKYNSDFKITKDSLMNINTIQITLRLHNKRLNCVRTNFYHQLHKKDYFKDVNFEINL